MSWRWLETTRRLQSESFGVSYEDLTGDKLADYALMNAYALIDEISEAMDEVAWKPWAKDRGTVNRDAMLGELVDAGHFLANLLAMLGVTDEEWETAYQAKQQRNARRQESGYENRQDKCPACRRELDKPGAMQVAFGREIHCTGCGRHLGMIQSPEFIQWAQDVLIKNATYP